MRGTHRFQKYGPRAYPVTHTYAHWIQQEAQSFANSRIAVKPRSKASPGEDTEPSPVSMDMVPTESCNPGKRLLERLPTDTWSSNKRRKTPADQELDQISTCATRAKGPTYTADMLQQMRFLARFFPTAD